MSGQLPASEMTIHETATGPHSCIACRSYNGLAGEYGRSSRVCVYFLICAYTYIVAHIYINISVVVFRRMSILSRTYMARTCARERESVRVCACAYVGKVLYA